VLVWWTPPLFSLPLLFQMIGKVTLNANYHLHPNIQGVSFLCVDLEVLKTTTTTNTNLYHPNMANIYLQPKELQ
jgi:hypothetical protein